MRTAGGVPIQNSRDIQYGHSAPETRLWQQVLVEQMKDLLHVGTSKDVKRRRRAAEAWVGAYPRPDFREVCQLADVDAHAAHERMTTMRDLSTAAKKTLRKELFGSTPAEINDA